MLPYCGVLFPLFCFCATMNESLVYSVSGLFIYFFLPIESNSPGKILLCFKRETVAKNGSVTQMHYLEQAGEITCSVWWSSVGL